jgi:hypothetical protein
LMSSPAAILHSPRYSLLPSIIMHFSFYGKVGRAISHDQKIEHLFGRSKVEG